MERGGARHSPGADQDHGQPDSLEGGDDLLVEHPSQVDTVDLQELVSVPEPPRGPHRSLGQDGADIVVRPDLHPVLNINSPLQADPQSSSNSSFCDTANLQHNIGDTLAPIFTPQNN